MDGGLEPERNKPRNEATPTDGGSVSLVFLAKALDKEGFFVARTAEPQRHHDYHCEHYRDERARCEACTEEHLSCARVDGMEDEAIEALDRERLATEKLGVCREVRSEGVPATQQECEAGHVESPGIPGRIEDA